MKIGLLGISFKTTNIHLRESFAKAFKRISQHGFILLSTCNRQEIYFSGEDLSQLHEKFLFLLRGEIHEEFQPFLYSYFGRDAFFHLAKVTAGLDSAILGESEIQGQVKKAYCEQANKGELSSSLHFLFQKCLKIGKEIRNQTWLLPNLSLAQELDQLMSHLLGTKSHSLFFLGNSKINRNLIGHFLKKGWNQLTLCTRHPVSIPNIQIISWDQLSKWKDHEICIAAAKNAHFVIDHVNLVPPKTKMLFDLSVPRNAHPAWENDPFIHFFNLEKLESLFKKNNKRYFNNVQLCEMEVKEQVEKYYSIFERKSVFVI